MTIYYEDEWVTLHHGDCLEERAWLDAHVLMTDPPYGMKYKSNRKKHRAIQGDASVDLRQEVLTLWGERPAVMFGTWKVERPDRVRQLVVWDKRGGAGFSGDLNMPWADITEEIYIFGQGWVGPRVPAIYSIPTMHNSDRPDHPTPKPVKLMGELIQHAPPGVICDPMAGSGSTLVAARNLGRKAVGVEIDERYCEIIARRLGQQAFIFDDESEW